jgi:hypothetical protein
MITLTPPIHRIRFANHFDGRVPPAHHPAARQPVAASLARQAEELRQARIESDQGRAAAEQQVRAAFAHMHTVYTMYYILYCDIQIGM